MKNFLLLILIGDLLLADCKVASGHVEVSIHKFGESLPQTNYTKCRYVCDEKISKIEKMSNALEFYKNSKLYTFSK